MFRALRNLFVGSRSAKSRFIRDRNGFLRGLAAGEVWLFVASDQEGIDPATMTSAEVMETIERSVKDLNESESFEPFIYDAQGLRRLPFFTSQQHAETFVGEYS